MLILKFIFGLVILAIFMLFTLSNAKEVVTISFDISFFGIDSTKTKIENINVMIVILMSFSVGFLVSTLFIVRAKWISLKKTLNLKKTMRKKNKEIAKQEKEMANQEKEIDQLKKEIPYEQKQISYENDI